MKLNTLYFNAYILLQLTVFSSCNSNLSISELLQNPREFEGKIVSVEGQVINSNGIFGLGYFEISDGKSKIYVFTESGLPNEGNIIQVKGKFSQYLKVGLVQVVGIEEGEIIR